MAMKIFRSKTWVLATITFCYVVLLVAVQTGYSASAIAKGYATNDSGLKPGMVTALSGTGSADAPEVKRAAQGEDDKIIGVATTPQDELVSISSGQQSQVFVQVSGEVDVYVTDMNGSIKKGDLLTTSPILGVLMKASNTPALVVGVALADFDASTAETKTINDKSGDREVKAAKIKANIDHKASSNQEAARTDSSLQRLGTAISGSDDVTELQVAAALVIFLVVLVAEGAIIYGAVSSTISALGRNPLARKIILKEAIRVLFITFGVLVIGLGAIYMILRV
jgi:hypothetical protein